MTPWLPWTALLYEVQLALYAGCTLQLLTLFYKHYVGLATACFHYFVWVNVGLMYH